MAMENHYVLVKPSDIKIVETARVPVAVLDGPEHSATARTQIPVKINGRKQSIPISSVAVSRVYLDEFDPSHPGFNPITSPVLMPWPADLRRDFDKAKVRSIVSEAVPAVGQPLFESLSVASSQLKKSDVPFLNTVRSKLRTGRSVYLKPTNGAQGVGVVRLFQADGKLNFETNDGPLKDALKNRRVSSLTDFIEKVYLPRLGNAQKTRRLIFEDEIPSEKVHIKTDRRNPLRACELRFTLIKTGDPLSSQYKVSGVYAKVGPNAISSNLSTGGYGIGGHDLVRQLVRQRFPHLEEREVSGMAHGFIDFARNSAEQVADTFATRIRSELLSRKGYPAHKVALSEMTVDLTPVYDKQRGYVPYLLEVNAGRMSLKGLRKSAQPTFDRHIASRVLAVEDLWREEVSRRVALPSAKYASNVERVLGRRRQLDDLFNITNSLHLYSPDAAKDPSSIDHVTLLPRPGFSGDMGSLLTQMGLSYQRAVVGQGSKNALGYHVRRLDASDPKRFEWFARNVGVLSGRLSKPIGNRKGVNVMWKKIESVPSKFIFGVTANKLMKNPASPEFFGFKTRELAEMSEEAHKTGSDFVIFNPKGVNWAQRRVKGHDWDPQRKQWVEVERDFPHAILPRLHGRVSEEDSQRLYDAAPYVNPKYLTALTMNKRTTAQTLRSRGVSHPITDNYSDDAVGNFLTKHGSIFVKPKNGMGGYGILRIDRVGNAARIEYKLDDKHAAESRTVPMAQLNTGIRGVLSHIEKAGVSITSDLSRYVMQPTIPIKKVDGKSWSVRAVFNLTDDQTLRGKLLLTGFGVFLGRAGSPMSNHGSSPADLNEVLKKAFGTRAPDVHENIRKEAWAAVNAFTNRLDHNDKEPGARLGHAGVELIVDDTGKAHVVEVNGAPWMGHLAPSKRRLAYQRLIEAGKVQARLRGTYPAAA